jgi:hypothetical protein
LSSDFLCSSQLLPLFNLYKPHYGQIQVASVSCSVRRFRRFLEPLCPPSSVVIVSPAILSYVIPSYYAVLDMIDRASAFPLRGLSFSDHRFLFRPVILCFMFHVLCFIAFTFRIGFLWCLSVLDYGFGMFVFGIAFMAAVYRHLSRPASILTALFLPHASSPSLSPPVSLLLRHRLRSSSSLSFPSVAFISESPPQPRPPSFNLQFFVRRLGTWLSRGLSIVGGRYCHKCRS